MIVYVIAGVLALIGLVLAAQWFSSANPRTLATVVRWSVIGAVGVGSAFLVLTGRIAAAFMLATGFLPFLKNWGLFGGAKGGKRGGGQTSEVMTDTIRMRLDHDSGLMEGEVLRGRFKRRKLGDFSKDDLLALLDECRREDADGARLVETFLDKAYPDWRDAQTGTRSETSAGSAGSTGGGMTREEAYRVLGLRPGASDEDIRQAHRRLMQKVHPDRGGSDYLAAKLNEAKDFLLGGRAGA